MSYNSNTFLSCTDSRTLNLHRLSKISSDGIFVIDNRTSSHLAHGGRRVREQPWMRHVTHQMTKLILKHKDACKSCLVLNLSQAKRIECALRAVIKLYCTGVSCECVSCLHPPVDFLEFLPSSKPKSPPFIR